MADNYNDIINLPHHVSATRPQMSMMDRAAQFSPFAALTGYSSFSNSPFFASVPLSASGRYFQLSGNKKRGFASYSVMEKETNPLSFS